MFKKILIANRGEIALRIIQACRELGIKTVAVYSTADRDSLHVTLRRRGRLHRPAAVAGELPQHLGASSRPPRSPAPTPSIPATASCPRTPHFAEVCEECQLTFIGPRPEAIRLMGDKAKARADGDGRRRADAPRQPRAARRRRGGRGAWRAEIGYPVILKAAAGGGGRGMRIVRGSRTSCDGQFATARTEARDGLRRRLASTSRSTWSSRATSSSRSSATATATAIHLGERECSIQRRHQKLIEESPSPALDRRTLRDAHGRGRGARSAQAVRYENAGTIEFLLDERRQLLLHGDEHPHPGRAPGDRDGDRHRPGASSRSASPPASRSTLPERPEAARARHRVPHQRRGPARPSRRRPGQLTTFHLPGGPGVRVDTHGYEDYVVPPHYDSLIAKLIVHGRDRDEAIARDAPRARLLRGRGHPHHDPAPPAASCATPTSSPASSRRASWSASCERETGDGRLVKPARLGAGCRALRHRRRRRAGAAPALAAVAADGRGRHRLDPGARQAALRPATCYRAGRALAARGLEGSGAALWVDDRADLAALFPVAGVHLGQADLPPAAARRVVGRRTVDRPLDPRRGAARGPRTPIRTST